MLNSLLVACLCALLALGSCFGPIEVELDPAAAEAGSFYGLEALTLEGDPAPLSAFAGQVALVVNTASECGFTGQYAELQALHEELGARGFVVLGFPSNDFGGQEPGSNAQIRAFCTEKFSVTFPLFAKVSTRAGPDQAPVFAYLGAVTGKLPGWNFSKYLIGRDGRVLGFWSSTTGPRSASLRAAIDAALDS
jgi:glutathione peroxidase